MDSCHSTMPSVPRRSSAPARALLVHSHLQNKMHFLEDHLQQDVWNVCKKKITRYRRSARAKNSVTFSIQCIRRTGRSIRGLLSWMLSKGVKMRKSCHWRTLREARRAASACPQPKPRRSQVAKWPTNGRSESSLEQYSRRYNLRALARPFH